jgi:hypothetical protein
VTQGELAELRKQKDRERKMKSRRRAMVESRAAYLARVASLKPWINEGISERTYYRRKAKDGRGFVQTTERLMADGSSAPQN